jgi:hypothetical protein
LPFFAADRPTDVRSKDGFGQETDMRNETRGPQGTGVVDEQDLREREGDRGPALSTADLASSARQQEQRPRPQEHREGAGPAGQGMNESRGGAAGAVQQGAQEHTPLLPEQEVQSLRSRWEEIQVAFVDSPHHAVQEADGLVAEAMKRLAEVFAAERAELESQWSRGQDVSTEDLRQALQRYRSFFGRLLSV